MYLIICELFSYLASLCKSEIEINYECLLENNSVI